MLSSELKAAIQSNYSRFLTARGLRPRHGQKLMIAQIANTLGRIQLDEQGARISDSHICVSEAGTGTGKTVAYLLAAIPVAKALGKHLVVSTATVALQEQIVYKDLPDLKQACELPLTFALAKGRGRYLCLAKLDRQLNEFQAPQSMELGFPRDDDMPSDEATIKLYRSMMDALARNDWDGDRDNWPTAVDERQWRPVTTNHRECSGRRCSFVGNCSFFKARESLAGVDCIVTNHDLVLSDLALGGGAILPAPEDALYIFDEGHHLPEKALAHFTHYSRLEATQRWFDECNQSLPLAAQQLGDAGNLRRRFEQLPDLFDHCKRLIASVQPRLMELFDAPQDLRHSQRYRFEHGIVPTGIREVAAELAEQFDRITTTLEQICGDVSEALEDAYSPVPKVDLENWFPVLGAWAARAEGNRGLWYSYATPDNGDLPQARWLEKIDTNNGVDIALSSSPILAADTLANLLWQRCCGAVVTSATLTALGSFDRLSMRAGLPADASFQVVPSPFDYSRVNLQIPAAACDAGDAEAHTAALIDALPNLLNDSEGNLVLFASRRQMLDVYEQLPENWQARILLQDERSKQETLAEHRRRIDAKTGSIIFGLASFAEGVDLPGDYCRHVVIAKIPFAVPDDPLDAALAEWIRDRGGNPFMEISVPDAALKLVQACGRLLRTETDAGTVTIMDRRLLTRQYGKAMLAALPPFTRLPT